MLFSTKRTGSGAGKVEEGHLALLENREVLRKIYHANKGWWLPKNYLK